MSRRRSRIGCRARSRRGEGCRATLAAGSALALLSLALTAGAAGAQEEAEEAAGAEFPVLASLEVGENPHQIAFSPDGETAYVAAAGSDRITHVDVRTREVVGFTPVPGTPLGVTVLSGGDEIAVSRFRGTALARYDLRSGRLLDTIPLSGQGASLFTPLAGDRWLVPVEESDEVHVLSGATFEIEASYAVGDRPFPAAATSDARLAFVPGYDDGTVTVVDLWNGEVLETVRVGSSPSGGGVLPGDVTYWSALRGEDRLIFFNTASHRVVGELSEGIGEEPFSVVLAPNGRLAFVNNTASHEISVVDVARKRVIARVPVPEIPIVMAVHPSGKSLWVSSEGRDRLTVLGIPRRWREGELAHDGFEPNPGAPGGQEWRPDPTITEAGGVEGPPAEVAVMGMIHGRHRTSERWGLEEVRETVRRFRPDVVCAEIPPDRWERIRTDFRERGAFEDSRIRVFPEYVDAILPLTVELGFEIRPCAGWTRELARLRRERVEAFAEDRPEERADYQRERARVREERGGPYDRHDDPRYIHSEAYDEAARAELGVYDRWLNEWIGPGGWTNVNVAHWRLVARVIRRNPGARILVTFGAGHKYWLLDRLREQAEAGNLRLLDLAGYLPAAR